MPTQQPVLVTYYLVDGAGYWTGQTRQMEDGVGVPGGYALMSSAPPSLTASQWARADGDKWVKTTVDPNPAPSLADLKAGKCKTLADYRWQRTQVMDYDGETDVPADPAMSVITSIAVVEQLIPSNGATRTFKLKAGVFRTWNVTQIITYGMAIGNHVQSCFNHEASLYAQIEAAQNATALNAIDIFAGWPGNS